MSTIITERKKTEDAGLIKVFSGIFPNSQILPFFILSLIVGNKYRLIDYLLAPTGWTSLGNSNWFIFVILALYAITAIAFWVKEKLLRSDSVLLIPVLTSLLSVCLWIALYVAGKDAYWYNTLLCYGLGMYFALIKASSTP